MFHLFEMYVAFKYFMLHVFHAIRRVRGRWGMGRDESVAGGRGALGVGGLGHGGVGCARGGRANGWG